MRKSVDNLHKSTSTTTQRFFFASVLSILLSDFSQYHSKRKIAM